MARRTRRTPAPSPAPPSSAPTGPSRTRVGRCAEARVAAVLESRGWRIEGLNVRVGRDELDVVARQAGVLVVVEVRARSSHTYGDALETIGPAKRRHLRRALLGLMARTGDREARIDVAAVRGDCVEIVENAVEFSDDAA